MSAIALLVAATLAQAGTLRSDLALRGGGAQSPVVGLSQFDAAHENACGPSVTNSALYSEDLGREATWAEFGGVSVTADSESGFFQLVGTTNSGVYHDYTGTFPNDGSTFAASIVVKGGQASLAANFSGAGISVCTCAVDVGTCAAEITASNCIVYTTASSGAAKLEMNITPATTIGATFEMIITPGRYKANGGTAVVGRPALRRGYTTTGTYCPTTSAAATCSPHAVIAKGSAISVSRGPATYQCGGVDYDVADGYERIEANGLLVEPYSANYFLNACTAPATQTITNAAGQWSSWIEGSGSVTIAAGTATATGLPCTATSSSPCRWTVSSGGTVTATKAGTVTFAQVEPSREPTSKICAAGTPLARADEVLAQTLPLTNPSGDWTVQATARPRTTWAPYTSPDYRIVWGMGTSGANRAVLAVGPTALLVHYDGAGKYKSVEVEHDATVRHTYVASLRGGVLRLLMDGIEPAAITNDDGGTGTWSALPTSLNLGGPVYGLNGWIESMSICRRGESSACGWSITPGTRVACLGDSITVGQYPAHLQGLLGTSYTVINSGVSGNITEQMRDRWRSSLRGTGLSWLVVLGGINDVRRDTSAATAFAPLKDVLDEARADGINVVVMRLLPFRGDSLWTAGRQAIWSDYNALLSAYGNGTTVLSTDVLMGEGVDGGTSGDWLKAAYDSGDGLHPNAAGKNAMAAAVKAVIAP